ncbi:HTH-type transcriptional activator mta [compost metagenome]
MAYTMEEVSDISGIPIEELNHYEHNDWLKPSLVSKDGIHYYDERGLLCLQHLMICQELVMPGEEMAMWMHRYEEAPTDVLLEHRLRIMQKAQRMHLLVQTIDLTLGHLNGESPLEHRKLFSGLQLQGHREEQEQSQQPKAWPKEKNLQSQAEVEEVHSELIAAIKDGEEPGSKRVQAIIRRHLEWISHFYTPTAQIYSDLGDLYVEHEDFYNMYREYHPRLAEFLRDGMKILAACELK